MRIEHLRAGHIMQYRPHRYPTQFPIKLRTASGQQDCQVLDVNSSGARIAGPRGLRRGEKVQFTILNHHIEAVVCWAASARAGVIFRPHLTDVQVDTLRYRRDGARHRRHGPGGFAYAEMR